jgi:signal transduction histidine kinase
VALKYAEQDAQVAAMQAAVAEASGRLRRMMRRMHLYAQLPQLYANRFELLSHRAPISTESAVTEAAREICRHWNREADLVIALAAAPLSVSEEYLRLLVEELVDNACKFSSPATPAIYLILTVCDIRCQNVTSACVYNGFNHFHPAACGDSRGHDLTGCDQIL